MSNKNFFGSHSEAVVAVKDGEIKFFNGTAARLIPNIESRKPEDIFPHRLIDRKTENCCEEVDIEGVRTFVTVRSLDDCHIYSIVSAEFNELDDVVNLLTSVGIELKNSLSVSSMASSLLLPYTESIGNPRINRYSSMLYHSFYNILRLTNNMSDLADILRNDAPMICSTFDMALISEKLVDSVRLFVGERGVSIRYESAEENLVVYADRSKLEKLLLNLIANSLACTAAGGTVLLKLTRSWDRFILTVSDNGDGIPNEEFPNAWNKYNVPKQLNELPSGVGLGLTLVYNIARQHGGSAVLESKQGTGTSVTVSIPISASETTEADAAAVDEGCSMQQILTELSGVVDYEKYTSKYMD